MFIAVLSITIQTGNRKLSFYSMMDKCIIFVESVLINKLNDLQAYESLRMSFTNIILSERRQHKSIHGKIPLTLISKGDKLVHGD